MSIADSEMCNLSDIQSFVKAHRTYDHPIFDSLGDPLVGTDEFQLFAANFLARTVFTLTEILAGCQNAALELNFTRISYGVLTAADEGGFGNPARVHPLLMAKSINNHLVKAYGGRPIDLRKVFFALQGLELCQRLELYDNVSQALSAELSRSLACDVMIPEMVNRLKRILKELNPGVTLNFLTNCRQQFECSRSIISKALDDEKILPTTVTYCLSQLELLRNPKPGYIAGVTYAHEMLGDRLFAGISKVFVGAAENYQDDSFWSVSYEYIREHGDYLCVGTNGVAAADRVEMLHAMREEEKIKTLDNVELIAALEGACDFCDRDCIVWDGILIAISNGISRR